MIQTYQGFFLEDGRFFTGGQPVRLPTKRRVIINILDDETADIPVNTDVHHQQAAAVIKFLSDIAAIRDEDSVMTDVDWDELASIRSRTNDGLSRIVDL